MPSTVKIAFLLIALIVVALQTCARADAPPIDLDKPPPYVAHWGRYTIRIDGDLPLYGGRFLLFDSRGRVVRKIVNFSDVVRIQTVPYGRFGLLNIETQDDNELREHRDIYFEQTATGIRTDLVLQGASADPSSTCYNGRPLLVSPYSAPLESSADYFHAESPEDVPIVLGWNGSRYVEVMAKFKQFNRQAAHSAQYQVLQAPDDREIDLHAAVGNCYGNMYMIGEGRFGYRWILRNIPASTRPWFREYAPEFRRLIDASRRWATAPQTRDIYV